MLDFHPLSCRFALALGSEGPGTPPAAEMRSHTSIRSNSGTQAFVSVVVALMVVILVTLMIVP